MAPFFSLHLRVAAFVFELILYSESMTLLAHLLLLFGLVSTPDVSVKDITAPPQDITSGLVALPAPEATPTISVTALLPHHLIDSIAPGPGKSAAVLIAEDPMAWDFSIDTGTGPFVLEQLISELPQLTPGASGRIIRFTHPGDGLQVHPISVTPPAADVEGWILLADGREDIRLSTHFGSRLHTVGHPVLVHAHLTGASLDSGHIVVRGPSGLPREVTLLTAPDGGHVAMFAPDEPGDWTVRSVLQVVDSNGIPRFRTTQQLLKVLPREVRFTGPIRGSQLEDGRLELTIPVDLLPAPEVGGPRRAAVACELWGTDRKGAQVPVCWISRMHELPASGGANSIALRADPRWLALAEVDPATLEVRELRVHDARGFVLLDHQPRPEFLLTDSVQLPDAPKKVDHSMCAGRAPEPVSAHSASTTASVGGHVLLLSHGYCTDQFPFRVSNFSGDIELFEDYGSNLSNDEFALRFESYGRSFKSMGIVGHSQGGHAATHLYTFYWSALDWPTGGRRIQGVGVPWLGTALAGNAAVLGEVFGIGCGVVYDLTYDGSSAWLSFIPSWVRQETWYWTTSFEDGWFYDYCQIVTDLLLSDPDDGTVEQYAGQLSGGNNQGHKTGWCHTRLMRDPPQCKDADRNVVMDQEASR